MSVATLAANFEEPMPCMERRMGNSDRDWTIDYATFSSKDTVKEQTGAASYHNASRLLRVSSVKVVFY